MKPVPRFVPHLLAAALVCCPWAANAQGYSDYFPSGSYRSQFYLGGAIGASFYPDQTGATAGWFDNAYTATTSLSSGDFITTLSGQDATAFGAKVYGGAWITPHVALEAGWASLGRIGWATYSSNTTGSFSVNNSGNVAPHAWYEAVLLGTDWYGIRYFVKGGAYEASTDLEAFGFNDNTGAAFGGSQTFHNTGGLAGLGIHVGRGHVAMRLEVEDFINVGPGSMPVTSAIPPWHGSIVLLSAGVAYLF
jgi:hypothetical protein